VPLNLAVRSPMFARICAVLFATAAAISSVWAAYSKYWVLKHRSGLDVADSAQTLAILSTIVAATALGLALWHRRIWPRAYLKGTVAVSLFSIAVGVWTLAAPLS
jgi:hypothetical protein